MRIGRLAALTGVSVRSLRHYEDAGLLTAGRTPGGWREYAPGDVDLVVTIQHLLAGGLTTATIKELLPCIDASPEERTGMLQDRLAAEMARTEDRRNDLDRQLDVLAGLLADPTLAPAPRGDARP